MAAAFTTRPRLLSLNTERRVTSVPAPLGPASARRSTLLCRPTDPVNTRGRLVPASCVVGAVAAGGLQLSKPAESGWEAAWRELLKLAVLTIVSLAYLTIRLWVASIASQGVNSLLLSAESVVLLKEFMACGQAHLRSA